MSRKYVAPKRSIETVIYHVNTGALGGAQDDTLIFTADEPKTLVRIIVDGYVYNSQNYAASTSGIWNLQFVKHGESVYSYDLADGTEDIDELKYIAGGGLWVRSLSIPLLRDIKAMRKMRKSDKLYLSLIHI